MGAVTCEKCNKVSDDVTTFALGKEQMTVGNLCNECRNLYNLEVYFPIVRPMTMHVYIESLKWLRGAAFAELFLAVKD